MSRSLYKHFCLREQEVVKFTIFFSSDDIHVTHIGACTRNEDDCRMINYLFSYVFHSFFQIYIYSIISAFSRLKASSSHIFSSPSHWPSFIAVDCPMRFLRKFIKKLNDILYFFISTQKCRRFFFFLHCSVVWQFFVVEKFFYNFSKITEIFSNYFSHCFVLIFFLMQPSLDTFLSLISLVIFFKMGILNTMRCWYGK